MASKRGPLVKQLRQLLSEMPPENVAPWKEPNNKMKKIIRTQIQGKLGNQIQKVQESIAKYHLQKIIRNNNQSEGSTE